MQPRPTPPKARALPRVYRDAVARFGTSDIELDWRALGKKQPPMWPGTLYLFPEDEVLAENDRLKDGTDELDDRFFIGSNTCGLVFALDARGRVHVIDEIERDSGVLLAGSLAELLAARFSDATAAKAAGEKHRADALPRRWEAVEAIASQPRSFDYGFLPERIASLKTDYQVLGRLGDYEARVRVFVQKHASKRALLRKLLERGLIPKSGSSK